MELVCTSPCKAFEAMSVQKLYKISTSINVVTLPLWSMCEYSDETYVSHDAQIALIVFACEHIWQLKARRVIMLFNDVCCTRWRWFQTKCELIHKAFRIHKTAFKNKKPIRENFYFHYLPKLYIGFKYTW